VNTAKYNPRAASARQTAHFIATERITAVDADADQVAALDRVRIELFERFVDNIWVADVIGCRGSQNVQPPWSNDSDTERKMTGIDEMDAHWPSSLLCLGRFPEN
jgi:hypothetical protein